MNDKEYKKAMLKSAKKVKKHYKRIENSMFTGEMPDSFYGKKKHDKSYYDRRYRSGDVDTYTLHL